MADKLSQLADQERLLAAVFPHTGFTYGYLKWLYKDGPDGTDIPSDYRESNELLGHYTVVPQTWHFGAGPKRLALSLNTAVHEKARGKGLFTKLAEECYAEASGAGIQAIIGVANANSTPGFLGRLKFTLVSPLPVVAGIILPTLSGHTNSHAVTPEFLESPQFGVVADHIAEGRAMSNIAQAWTREKLAWRLSSPRARYALHTNPSGTLITTTAPLAAGIRATIALKFFPHHPKSQVDTKALLRKAVGFHRSPVFIYCGFNENATVRGLPLPRRLLPSPLNLIYRRLDGTMPDPDKIKFGTFEFFDFDAY